MRKIAFYTLGCKVNQYETEGMREKFQRCGYDIVDFSDNSDIYLINTCSVTAIADKKSRQAINKAHKTNPEAVIVVTGCYSQVSPEEIKSLDFANIIVGNNEKKDIVSIVENFNGAQTTKIENIMDCTKYSEISTDANAGKTRAFMKIQDGCNNFCTYCIIPYARGPVRSRNVEDVIKEAKKLAEAGYKEIVLTGIHLAMYGTDTKECDLADIILKLHDISGIERIRLGSLELTSVIGKIADLSEKMPKLCPHFHISLQSGSVGVLQRMKRRYTPKQYKTAIKMLKEKWDDLAITTDIMVGFPGETDDEFNESLEFAKNIEFAKIHVFPYSKRKGTVAAEMENQVDDSVKKERASKMQELAIKTEDKFYNNCINKEMNVLIERKLESGLYEGHAPNYCVVKVKGTEKMLKNIVNVRIIDVENQVLTGKLINHLSHTL